MPVLNDEQREYVQALIDACTKDEREYNDADRELLKDFCRLALKDPELRSWMLFNLEDEY